MKVTPTFLYPIFGLETTTTCPGCGLGTKLRKHNFVVVPRFTTRDILFSCFVRISVSVFFGNYLCFLIAIGLDKHKILA